MQQLRMRPHLDLLGKTLLLMLAYVLLGRLALWLAIPPGYVIAVYLPAGIGIGAVLVGGKRYAPGVAAGGFLVNLWIVYENQGQVSAASLTVPALVACGAGCHALFGAALVRKWVGYPTALDQTWQIPTFMALTGPVACTLNATVGTAALYHAGIVNADTALSNWAAWWLGDTLGVLIVVPLFMIWFGQPRDIWRSRRVNVGVPLVVSLFIVVTVFVIVRQAEQAKLQDSFRSDAARILEPIQSRLDLHTEMVKIMERHFASAGNVSDDDFRIFVSAVQARYPTLSMLEWAPRVAHGERARYEAQMRAAHGERFALHEAGAGGQRAPAAPRPDYFPVSYLEPRAGNGAALGYDLGAEAVRAAALARARDTGLTVASAPIAMVADAAGRPRPALLLVAAAYTRGMAADSVGGRRAALRGYTLSVVYVDKLLEHIFDDATRKQILFRLRDANAPPQFADLYNTLEAGRPGAPMHASLRFGEREYHFTAQPSDRYWDTHKSWNAWWALVGGLLFVSLLGMHLLLMSGQKFRVEDLVRQRTAELVASEDRVRDSAALMQTVFDSMPSYVHVRDLDGRYLYVNKEYERVFGLARGALIGRTLDDAFPPELARKYRDAETAVVQSGAVLRTEATVVEADGPHVYLVLRSPLFDENGRVCGACGVGTDISPLIEAERTVRELNARLAATSGLRKAMLNSANFSIISTGTDGVISAFNVGAERILGYTQDEMVGLHTPALLHDGDELAARAAVLGAELGRAVAPGFDVLVARARLGQVDEQEWTYIRKDGTGLPVRLSVTGLWNEAHELTGFLGVAYDITGQRKLQASLVTAKEQAEGASRAKSEFLANMSHEIRTPLNAVLGMAHLLGNTPLTDEQASYLGMISASGKSLLGILNDILDFSKIEAGQLELAPLRFELDGVLDAIASLMTVAAGDKDLELLIDVDAQVAGASYIGDAMRLQQILVNLIGNAIKFTDSGTVALQVACAPGADDAGNAWLEFCVRDSGIGMDAAQQAKLFSAFSQVDSSMTRRFGGTGLGLAICKRLATVMGGAIELDSAPGQGSTFRLRLPFKPAPDEGAAAPPAGPDGLRVLVVDDHAGSRAALGKLGRHAHWRLDCVASGAEATQAVAGQHYDLALVDLEMPGLDGWATLDALRALAPALPAILMVNAYGRSKLRLGEVLPPATAVLSKPLGNTALYAALPALLARHPPLAPAAPQTAPGLAGVRILLVEDNRLNQIVAQGVLDHAGATVAVAENGLEAVELLRARGQVFDLVLMDVQMPVMDGFTATRIIRDELRFDLPVIAMTAGVMLTEQEQCTASGMTDFIAKPVEISNMLEVIGRHLPARV